jgi:hypothetical protein
LQVNQLLLHYPQSNITFDSLVLENMGPGDAVSAEIAKPASLAATANFWALYFNRTEHRVTLRNVTTVANSQVRGLGLLVCDFRRLCRHACAV